MDTLIVVILVAMATTFSAEIAELALGWVPIIGRFVGSVLTFPLALVYHYILGSTYPMLLVASAASSFLALTFGIIVDRITTTYTEVRRGRR